MKEGEAESDTAVVHDRRRRNLLLKALGVVALLGLVVLLERRFQLSAILDPAPVEQKIEAAGPFGPVLFMLVMAATVLTPVPTFPLDILAGRVFGPFLGTLYAVTGATAGATISFLIARWLGRDLIARFLKGHINFCQRCSDKLLTKVVFLARLIPAVSFDMVSYGSGAGSDGFIWRVEERIREVQDLAPKTRDQIEDHPLYLDYGTYAKLRGKIRLAE